MNIKVNTEIIKDLNPCKNRLDNYLKHYENFSGFIEDFLDFEHISHSDKLWVCLRLVPKNVVEEFAVDCAMCAYVYDPYDADASYYAMCTYVYDPYDADASYYDTAYDAAYAALYATYAFKDVVYAKECQRQIEALIWLIQDHKG